MNRASHGMACLWLGALLLLGASGCKEEVCDKGESECLSGSLLRTCVAGEDGNEWFIHACGQEEVCGTGAGAGAGAGAGGSSSGSDGAGVMCLGTCTEGTSECASDLVARFCVNGRGFQIDP